MNTYESNTGCVNLEVDLFKKFNYRNDICINPIHSVMLGTISVLESIKHPLKKLLCMQ